MSTTPLFDDQQLDEFPLTFSFGAAGWLQMYHFGVGKALQELGVVDSPLVRVAGTSAGSIAATGLAIDVDMDLLREYSVECSNHCRSQWKNAFLLRDYILGGVDKFVVKKFQEEPEATKRRLNERLEMYATVLPQLKGKKFSRGDFQTPECIGEAMAASCCLPPIAGFPFKLRTGEWVMDGGLTAFQPRANEPNVITASALYGPLKAHIKPTSSYIPMYWCLYPPSEECYRQVYDIGYNDAVTALVEMGKIEHKELSRLRTITMRGGKITSSTSGDGLTTISWLTTVCRDTLVVLLFLCVVRPIVMILIYCEIILSGLLSSITLKWHHVYTSARNLVSFRTWVHLNFFGDKVPINNKRLERSSWLYRLLRPVVYDLE